MKLETARQLYRQLEIYGDDSFRNPKPYWFGGDGSDVCAAFDADRLPLLLESLVPRPSSEWTGDVRRNAIRAYIIEQFGGSEWVDPEVTGSKWWAVPVDDCEAAAKTLHAVDVEHVGQLPPDVSTRVYDRRREYLGGRRDEIMKHVARDVGLPVGLLDSLGVWPAIVDACEAQRTICPDNLEPAVRTAIERKGWSVSV